MQKTTSPPLLPQASAPALMTAVEFARQHGGDYVELVDGIAQELPMASPK